MRFAISTPNVGPIGDLLELARETEAAGWDGLFVWDHLHLDRQQLFPVHDPWVLLGAMAPVHPPPPPRPPRDARGPPPAVGAGQAGRHPRPPHRRAGRARRRPRLPGRPRSSAPSATRPTTASAPTSSTRAWRSSPPSGPATPSTTRATHFRVDARSSSRCPSSSPGRRSGWPACGPTGARSSGPPATTASCRSAATASR